jgi:hypothetical protein
MEITAYNLHWPLLSLRVSVLRKNSSLLGAREEPSLLSNQAVLPIVMSSRWVLCSPRSHSPLRLANRANPFHPSEPGNCVGAGAPARESRHRQSTRGDSRFGCPAGRSTAVERDEQTKVRYPGRSRYELKTAILSEAKNLCIPFVVPTTTNRIEEQARTDVATFTVMFILSQIPHALRSAQYPLPQQGEHKHDNANHHSYGARSVSLFCHTLSSVYTLPQGQIEACPSPGADSRARFLTRASTPLASSSAPPATARCDLLFRARLGALPCCRRRSRTSPG